MSSEHAYTTRLVWEGNTGDGTAGYTTYGRQYRVLVPGKPDIQGSADPVFRGEAGKHNPEDLFLASISACHMLVYLALCARTGLQVLSYEDDARGTVRMHAGGGGWFEEVSLRPAVTVAQAEDAERALRLHDRAHELCFIANSCSVAIHVAPTASVASLERRESECA